MSVVEHPELGLIECVRSMRTRSIRLVVRRNGTLRITYPLFSSLSKAIAFAESKAQWISATREKFEQQREHYPTITRHEVELLRRAAREYIPPTFKSLAEKHGFSYRSLRISSAHTRWGSCSGNNSISISLFVMLLPEHLREFIILHELCHTRHHNHAAAFHQLLNSLVGGLERELNSELKRHRIPRIEEV